MPVKTSETSSAELFKPVSRFYGPAALHQSPLCVLLQRSEAQTQAAASWEMGQTEPAQVLMADG